MPDQSPIRHYPTLCLVVLLSVFASVRCRAQGNPPVSPEEVAIARLKAIDAAEETYRYGNLRGYGTYANLAELAHLGLVDLPKDYPFEKDGYRFRDIAPVTTPADWGISAQPLEGTQGRTLVVTMDHHIRGLSGDFVTEPADLTTARDGHLWPIIETIGDVDDNGATEVSDAVEALRSVAGIVQLTERQSRCAEVTQDAQVDVQDAIMILKMALNDFLSHRWPN